MAPNRKPVGAGSCSVCWPARAATVPAARSLISCGTNLQSNLNSQDIDMVITDQQVKAAEDDVASQEAELKGLSDKMETMKVRTDRFIMN